MLFLLPPEIVPACVGLGLAGGALIGTLRGLEHPERIVTGITDAWYAVGAALVVVAAGGPPAELEYWAVPLLALLAQCAVDLLTATIREWLGRGIAPAAQLRVIADVYAIDACLTPVGFLVAMAAAGEPFAFVLILPLLALLAALAADRAARIREARRPPRRAHRGARPARPGDPPDRRGVRLQARPRGADRHRAAHGGRGARRRLRAGEPRRRAASRRPSSRPRTPPSRPARCGSPSTATTRRWRSR